MSFQLKYKNFRKSIKDHIIDWTSQKPYHRQYCQPLNFFVKNSVELSLQASQSLQVQNDHKIFVEPDFKQAVITFNRDELDSLVRKKRAEYDNIIHSDSIIFSVSRNSNIDKSLNPNRHALIDLSIRATNFDDGFDHIDINLYNSSGVLILSIASVLLVFNELDEFEERLAFWEEQVIETFNPPTFDLLKNFILEEKQFESSNQEDIVSSIKDYIRNHIKDKLEKVILYQYFTDDIDDFDHGSNNLQTQSKLLPINKQCLNIQRNYMVISTEDSHRLTKPLLSHLNSSDVPLVRNIIPAYKRVDKPGASLPKYLLAGEGADDRRRYFLPDEIDLLLKIEHHQPWWKKSSSNSSPQNHICQETLKNVITEVLESIDKGQDKASWNILVQHQKPGYYTISMPENTELFSFLEEVNQHPDVIFAEPSELTNENPNDSFNQSLELESQDHLNNMPENLFLKWLRRFFLHDQVNTALQNFNINASWGLRHTGFHHAWARTRGKGSVYLAVIDSSIETVFDQIPYKRRVVHPGFKYSDIQIIDWITNNEVPSATVMSEHGTSVTSVSTGHDIKGQAMGAAPTCPLVSVWHSTKLGVKSTTVDAIYHLVKLAHNNPQNYYVINCSFEMSYIQALQDAVEEVDQCPNIFLITTSGNADADLNQNPLFPACFKTRMGFAKDMVTTVASTNRLDSQTPLDGNCGEGIVDFCAPGVKVKVAKLQQDQQEPQYGEEPGTSFASPLVASLLALLLSESPSPQAQSELEHESSQKQRFLNLIRDNCDEFPDTVKNPEQWGAGIINAAKAMSQIL